MIDFRNTKSVILPDVHLEVSDKHKAYDVTKKFIADFKPDKIVLLGDYSSCVSLSHWLADKKRKIEGKRYKKEIGKVEQELAWLAKYTDEIIWLEGNHENWVEQYIDKNPEMEGVLEYYNMIDLAKYKTTWIPMDKYLKAGHLYLHHGTWTGKYHANKHLERLGCNICYGHTHRPQVMGSNARMKKPIKAVGLGCLCDKRPDYLKGVEGDWIHQFAILYVADNGEFNLYPIDIINNRFYYGGKSYAV